MSRVEWDDAALEELLRSTDGPVGRFLTEKSMEMTARAEARAPVKKPKNYSWGLLSSTAQPSGYLKSSIRSRVGHTYTGSLFGSTEAAYDPTIFLEDGGGRHGHAERIPFMTEALYSMTID